MAFGFGRTTVAAAEVKVTSNTAGVTSGLAKAEGGLKGFLGNAKGLMATAGIAMGGAALIGGIKGALGAASDLNESVSKTKVLFEDNADAVLKWSGSASTSLGMSKQQALDAAGNFNTMARALNATGGEATKFSTAQTQLSADLASFFNLDPSEAADKLAAAYRGEYEPARSLGIILDKTAVTREAARMGLIKHGGELTKHAQLLATQKLIQEQTTKAQGDFARTSDGAANQQKILTAQVADFKAKMGGLLLPVLTLVLGVLNGLGSTYTRHKDLIQAVAIGVGIAAVAFGGYFLAVNAAAIGTAILGAAMTALPFVAIGLAIVAVVAGIVMLYKRSGTFRAIVTAAVTAVMAVFGRFKSLVGTVVSFIRDHWRLLVAMIPGIGPALLLVIGNFNRIRSVVGSVIGFIGDKWGALREKVTGIASGIGEAFSGALRAPVNAIIDLLNAIELPEVKIPLGPTIGGGHPFHISHVASGGYMHKGRPYLVGELGPELVFPGQDSYVANNAKLRAMGAAAGSGGSTVNITIQSLHPADASTLRRVAEYVNRGQDLVNSGRLYSPVMSPGL